VSSVGLSERLYAETVETMGLVHWEMRASLISSYS